MTTELGKELRKLRIDKDERLLDMARRLGKSTAGLELVMRGLAIPTGIELTPTGQRMAARLGRYDTKEAK